jgi:hypothetical protein
MKYYEGGMSAEYLDNLTCEEITEEISIINKQVEIQQKEMDKIKENRK